MLPAKLRKGQDRCSISGHEEFAGVTPAEFELIASAAQSKYFDDAEMVFEEGSPIREMAMLLSGLRPLGLEVAFWIWEI